MADSKISALTDGNPAQSGDEIPIARSGANYKITAGSIASLGGDVDGPASSTDNAVARFDSTTGKLIQNSGVTIDDSNNLTLPGQADLRFADSDSSNWVAFQAPATVASNVTWTLPNADGTSGQVLSTDGSGTLSWATGGGGGGSGTVTSVAFSAGTTGLSVSGSPITTSGTITLAGTLGVANGGTGATTLTGLVKGSGTSAFSAATAGTDYVAPAGAFSGLSWQSVQTTGFTAVAFRAYPCNTTSAAFTVTLPASPSAGAQITLTDYAGTFGTNALTINPNGGKIRGSTANQVISTSNNSAQLVYVDSTQGWLVYGAVTSTPFLPPPSTVEYLIIGGGGGGSAGNDGGGGAGGYRTNSSLSVSQGVSYTLTIGAGGTGLVSPSTPVTAGSASSMSGPAPFTTISSAGGGQSGAAGGSGGGGTSFPPSAGGAGTAGQGNAGGSGNGGVAPGFTGGGGGGAGGVGSNGTSTTGGAGGPGSASTITGPSVTRAGGGGGGSRNGAGFGGAAGSGGGGAGGGSSAQNGGAGTANTGGGGGAGGFTAPNIANGGNGGSGVIIIAYPNTYANIASIGAGLTVTLDTTTRSGYKVYTFTAGTGTISW